MDTTQPPKGRKPRKDKERQEKYYPPFVPMVSECFNIKLDDGSSIQWIDAYMIGLIQFCEAQMIEHACSFSAETIAAHTPVTRYTVMNSITRLEKNQLIIRTKRKGKPPLLNLSTSKNLEKLTSFRQKTCGTTQQDSENMLNHSTGFKQKSCGTIQQDNKKVLNDSTCTCGTIQHDNAKTCGTIQHKRDYIYNNNNIQTESQKVKDSEKKNDSPVFDERLRNIISLWENGTGRAITPFQIQKLDTLIADFSYEWVTRALVYVFERGNVANVLPYITTVLENWQSRNEPKPWEHDSRPTASQSAGRAMTQEELDKARAQQEEESARIHKRFLESEDW